jgi:hypothetical protein
MLFNDSLSTPKLIKRPMKREDINRRRLEIAVVTFFISIPLMVSRFSYFLWICSQSVGLLGRVIGPSQGLYLNTGQHKHRKTRTHTKHPCPKWDSNPRSQRPSERKQFMPQTARPPWPAWRWWAVLNDDSVCGCFVSSEMILHQPQRMFSDAWDEGIVMYSEQQRTGEVVVASLKLQLWWLWWCYEELSFSGCKYCSSLYCSLELRHSGLWVHLYLQLLTGSERTRWRLEIPRRISTCSSRLILLSYKWNLSNSNCLSLLCFHNKVFPSTGLGGP